MNCKDEIQAKVALKDVEAYCEICEEAMVAVGEALGFRCPLAAEAKVGSSWAYTH
jgi:DNA polymerase I-like protein with 3'-5' exonuclease and polymerase domains